jgi:glycosyltransferase involved in cell wall biosynthesis/SAM-dependent methyltransferase
VDRFVTGADMNVLLIAASEFAGNSALHTLSVARFMQARGIECSVSYRSDHNNVRPGGDWPFRICDHLETMHNGVLFPDGRGPDLIHAWTPREHVRKLTACMVDRYGCPYIVHLEDNEEVIVADTLGRFSYGELARLPPRITDRVISPYLSHPKRYRGFLESAAAVTALIDKLMKFKPEGLPGTVFWPGFEEAILTARGTRESFGLPEDDALLVYNGNIHLSNEAEVGSLIDGVGLLRRRGVPVMLVKTGSNHAAQEKLKQAQSEGYLIDLGFVSRAEIHSLLNLADVLVQPGRPSEFNDYRFPCKLPEFLATGKPVVLPKTNLGQYLRDGENCLLMETGDPVEIADRVQLLLQERRLGERIGRAGWEFAIQKLSWERNLQPVLALYEEVLAAPVPKPRSAPHDLLPVVVEKAPPRASNGETYLAQAAQSVAAGSGRVLQSADANPWLYEKWLAAEVERAMDAAASNGRPAVVVEGWREDPEWLAATTRGCAAGAGAHLRRAGLPISNLAIEAALTEEPSPQPQPAKSEAWTPESSLQRIVGLYEGSYKLPLLSYATVRDYCDSVDEMRCLATINGDLKNVQRPWAVKTVLGSVPKGGRILEIGAGEPWIADMLSRAGYEAWVVDPYDGSGNGPVSMVQFMSECPQVRFLRDKFTDQMLDIPRASFDCIYSVSLLEHLDPPALQALVRGIAKFLKPDGFTFHAVDHVQRGMGHREDMERLELLGSLFGIGSVELHATLQRLDRDLDAYTLSAEGLNQWRGALPYEQFRMRKWVSIQIATGAARVTRSLQAVDRP